MPILEEFLEDIACECTHCSGEAVDLIIVNGRLVCLACMARWNGKVECCE